MGNDKLSVLQVKWLTYLVYIILTIVSVSNGWLIAKIFDLESKKVNHTEYSEGVKDIQDELTIQRRILREEFKEVRKQIFELHKS